MPYPFDVDVPRFTAAEIARAVGWTMAALNNATRGETPIIRPDRPAGGTGRVNLFSYRRAMQFALTATLVEMGHKVSAAAKIAFGFTDSGSQDREPLHLFDGASTVLIAWRGAELGEVTKMVLPGKGAEATSMSQAFLSRYFGRQKAATVIWIDFIDKDLRRELGLS